MHFLKGVPRGFWLGSRFVFRLGVSWDTLVRSSLGGILCPGFLGFCEVWIPRGSWGLVGAALAPFLQFPSVSGSIQAKEPEMEEVEMEEVEMEEFDSPRSDLNGKFGRNGCLLVF